MCLFFARSLRKFFAHAALTLRKLCTNHRWIADKQRNKCVHVRFTNNSRMVYGFSVDFRVLCVVYSFVDLWWFICDTCTYSIFFSTFPRISTYQHICTNCTYRQFVSLYRPFSCSAVYISNHLKAEVRIPLKP